MLNKYFHITIIKVNIFQGGFSMQYLYNAAINRQSYNITSKEELFGLLQEGILTPYTTIYDLDNQTCVYVDDIPEVAVWKIIQNNKRIKRAVASIAPVSRFSFKFPKIKLGKTQIALALSIAVAVVIGAVGILYNYSNTRGYGVKAAIKADTHNKELLNAFAQIHKDYINKSEPDKEAFNNPAYGDNVVLVQKYASMVTKELQSESQLRNISAELQNQKLADLLNTKDGFALFQIKVKNLSFVFEQHNRERSASRYDMQSSIINTNIKEDDKKLLINQMGSVNGSFDQTYSDYCKNEVDLLGALYSQMEYLKNNTKKYRLEKNERLVFYNPKDLEEYSKIVLELENKIKKESEYVRELNRLKVAITE